MARHIGGEGPMILYTPDFFGWMECQIIMIEDFLYAGMYYTDDPYMPLPVGMKWGDLGKKFTFWLFCVFNFLDPKLTIQNDHADVALVRLERLHKFDRRGEQPTNPAVQIPDVAEALTELKHNLEKLTLDIPYVGIDDPPLYYQRHAMGVPGLISHLL